MTFEEELWIWWILHGEIENEILKSLENNLDRDIELGYTTIGPHRDDIKFENGAVEIDFDFAGKMLNKITKIVLKKGLPEGIDLLNVNVPANPVNEEFEVVKLGNRMYSPVVQKRLDPRGKPYYWIDGEPY